MPEKTGQFDWVIKSARIALLVTLIFMGLTVLAALAWTIWIAVTGGGSPLVAVGVAVVLVAAFEAVWAVVLYGLVHVIVANERAVGTATARLNSVESILGDQKDATRHLLELGRLSDQAKTLVYHEVEVDAFREAIHGNLVRQDWGAAEALAQSVEQKLGYPEEAQRLRAEIEASRKASLDEKIDLAVNRIMAIVARRDWQRALRESRRVMALFPDDPKITALPERIERARQRRKAELLQAYGEATRKNDVDAGIELLKELDQYLTAQEGAALTESARGVFKAKLHNLGVQFALRVTEQQWSEAVAVGEEIVRNFPNSRMAEEVRDKLEQLRTRAAQAATNRLNGDANA